MKNVKQLENEIIKNLNLLNITQKSEILDFIKFIKKKNENISDSTSVDSVFGKYKDLISSSDDFSNKKKIEKKFENSKFGNI